MSEVRSMLLRRPDESAFDYHKRLIKGKIVDKLLADVDYSELAELTYGDVYSSDHARKMFYGSMRTIELLEDEQSSRVIQMLPDDDRMLAELEEKKIELQIAKQKYIDQRTAFNKLVRERAREEELNEIIELAIADAVAGGGALKYEPPQVRVTSGKDLLVSLNDIHFGAVVDNYWGKYDSDICAQMMRSYIDDIIEIAEIHGAENCYCWANGDMISGNIHHSIAVTNKENVIEQVVGVSELLAEFLAELSKHFTKVHFTSVAGNHSRLDIKDRALMRERLDDLPEWYLRARMSGFENVEIGYGDKIDATMYSINVRGLNYIGVHGDYDVSPQKIQALQVMADRPVYAVLLGHMHHNVLDCVQGVRTVMAGSFLGMDDYAVSKRLYGQPEQMVLVCDEAGIKCSYSIDLRKNINEGAA